ncbi:MAG: hypothetical protein J0H17_13885 [Rhizobiales bacterium]|nr:hypothetical protein [Hyphomicrobiales bacterium]
MAQAAKVDLSRVTRWRLPKSRGGTDGLIPQRHHIALLDHADANGIRLKPEDFYPSRKSSRRPRKQARR